MRSQALEQQARSALARAGIEVNGSDQSGISVHNPDFYARVWRQGSIGLGESYMDGWWDSPRLDQFLARAFNAGLDRAMPRGWRGIGLLLASALTNRQTRRRAHRVGEVHYDVGNELFQSMLDRRMVYTTGRWERAATLDQAQEAKLDFICQKLAIEPGMRVLDIGCGWGGFAKYAAERYGAQVDGVTVSRQQLALGQKLCQGLPVELRLEDYRSVRERYDRVVSLGMFEHVGYRNYRTYFSTARRCLSAAGRMFLSTIGSNRTVRSTDPWIERYIFPNSHLPSIQQLGVAIEEQFIPLEWHNWAADYDRTLLAWYGNFEARWDKWQRQYGERFCRMWKFYLLASAAAFRARRLQVWQMLLAPL